MAEARGLWRKLPNRFQLSGRDNSSGRNLDLAGLWLIPAAFRIPNWEGRTEPGVSIKLFAFLSTRQDRRGVTDIDVTSLAETGIHALGRWHQHTGLTDEARLLDDLRALMDGPDGAASWRCPSGYWLGAETEVSVPFADSDSGRETRYGRKCRKLRLARTFIL